MDYYLVCMPCSEGQNLNLGGLDRWDFTHNHVDQGHDVRVLTSEAARCRIGGPLTFAENTCNWGGPPPQPRGVGWAPPCGENKIPVVAPIPRNHWSSGFHRALQLVVQRAKLAM